MDNLRIQSLRLLPAFAVLLATLAHGQGNPGIEAPTPEGFRTTGGSLRKVFSKRIKNDTCRIEITLTPDQGFSLESFLKAQQLAKENVQAGPPGPGEILGHPAQTMVFLGPFEFGGRTFSCRRRVTAAILATKHVLKITQRLTFLGDQPSTELEAVAQGAFSASGVAITQREPGAWMLSSPAYHPEG